MPSLTEGSALSHRLGFCTAPVRLLGLNEKMVWDEASKQMCPTPNMEEDIQGEMGLSVLLPSWAFTTHMPMFISRILSLARPFSEPTIRTS